MGCRMPLTFILCVAWVLSWTAETARAQTSPIPAADYRVARVWKLGGVGGWDDLALEESGARLFVSREERVDVIETVSGKLAGSIPRTGGVHGIAFAPALRRGYTSNGRSSTVSVFELDTLRVILEVPISGKSPGAIYYEPQQNHLITANRETANLTVLDASTLQIVATVPLPGPPESIASDGSGHVYVNIDTAPGKLVLIDAKTLTLKAAWPLKECANPTALAFDVANRKIIFRVREPSHGSDGFRVGQVHCPGRHRQRIRRRGIRCGFGPGVQLQRHRRHLDGDPSGFAGRISGNCHRHDAGQCTNHGAGSGHSQDLSGRGAI